MGGGSKLPEEIALPIYYEKCDAVDYFRLSNPDKAKIFDKPTSDAISKAGSTCGRTARSVARS